MSHLSPETLARLVDEDPSADERDHLARCRLCRDELDAFRTQRLALSHLPGIRPPAGDWERLEPRLRRQGLLRSRVGWGSGRQPWLTAAAALVLLLAGAALGAWLPLDRTGGPESVVRSDAGLPVSAPSILAAASDPSRELTLDEAGELVQLMERWYLEALLEYRSRAEAEQGPVSHDPLTRFAAIEALMAAGNAAVRELPADPFLNGLLINVRAEREATLRGIQTSTTRDWY